MIILFSAKLIVNHFANLSPMQDTRLKRAYFLISQKGTLFLAKTIKNRFEGLFGLAFYASAP